MKRAIELLDDLGNLRNLASQLQQQEELILEELRGLCLDCQAVQELQSPPFPQSPLRAVEFPHSTSATGTGVLVEPPSAELLPRSESPPPSCSSPGSSFRLEVGTTGALFSEPVSTSWSQASLVADSVALHTPLGSGYELGPPAQAPHQLAEPGPEPAATLESVVQINPLSCSPLASFASLSLTTIESAPIGPILSSASIVELPPCVVSEPHLGFPTGLPVAGHPAPPPRASPHISRMARRLNSLPWDGGRRSCP